MNARVQILTGDCLENLKKLPDASVHCCVTSPPYWGLRDYGHEGQLGLEPTPEEYVANMVEVFRKVRRVLRDDGTLWLNLGDSYVSNPGDRTKVGGFQANPSEERAQAESAMGFNKHRSGLKPKDLVGIPWRVAFALQSDGWWLRQDIVWSKPNPMPESIADRCTKAHEYVFLFAKSQRYFYDAEAVKEASSWGRVNDPAWNAARAATNEKKGCGNRNGKSAGFSEWQPDQGRNRRSVWTINTKPFSGAHFAVMPMDLAEPCIKAGTSEKGCCPICGTPWVRSTATEWQPTCECGGDWRVVQSPTGQVTNDDPSMQTGRAGFNRPRNDGEGSRPMYRWEQKAYAAQLRSSPHRADMEAEAGSAFAHYIRTDDSGARPVPAALLDEWLADGWLTKPEPPQSALDPVPCTVIDPFGGSGTVGVVAAKWGRNSVLCELNPEYVKIIESRLSNAWNEVESDREEDPPEQEAPASLEALFGFDSE